MCDESTERLAWAKENFGDEIACFETANEMLDSGLIDACIIATLHYTHPKYAMHLSSWLDKKVELPIDEDSYYEELMKRVETSKWKRA